MAPKAVLVGMPGSGKSTIGRRLAKAMRVPLLDTDVAIVETTARTIADIFANDGEKEFRRIVSLGGGAVTSPGVRDALAGHTVVYLEIGAAEGIRRTTGGPTRPLLAGADPAERYRTLMDERVPLYRQVATMRVNTNRRNPGAVVRYLAARLENPGTGQSKRRRRAPWRLSPPPATPCSSDKSDADTTPGAAAAPTPATPAALAARRAEARK